MRLSETFWRPKRRLKKVNFKPETFGCKTLNLFRKFDLSPGSSILLRSGDVVLCRTHETFTIPVDLAGVVFARSSYARLGLMVSPVAKFINPGWSGQMPLLIKNASPFPIELRPIERVAQVCFFKLSEVTTMPYATSGKYNNDEGGPTQLWQDICKQGLHKTSLASSHGEIERIISFGKRLKRPTLEYFLRKLRKYKTEERADRVVELFKSDLEHERRRFQVWLPAFVSIIFVFTFWWLGKELDEDFGAIGAILGLAATAAATTLSLKHVGKFDSSEAVQSAWESVNV